MTEYGIKQKVLREIIELAQKYALEKVILFGSRERLFMKSVLNRHGRR